MAENDGATADAGTNNTDPQADKPEAPRTFSQDEVNRVIADRLARERAKYSDYESLSERAQAAEDAQARADEASARAEAAEAAARRGEIAAAKGIPPALLVGPQDASAEALEAYADALADWRGSAPVSRPGSSALSAVTGAPVQGGAADAFADFFRTNLS